MKDFKEVAEIGVERWDLAYFSAILIEKSVFLLDYKF